MKCTQSQFISSVTGRTDNTAAHDRTHSKPCRASGDCTSCYRHQTQPLKLLHAEEEAQVQNGDTKHVEQAKVVAVCSARQSEQLAKAMLQRKQSMLLAIRPPSPSHQTHHHPKPPPNHRPQARLGTHTQTHTHCARDRAHTCRWWWPGKQAAGAMQERYMQRYAAHHTTLCQPHPCSGTQGKHSREDTTTHNRHTGHTRRTTPAGPHAARRGNNNSPPSTPTTTNTAVGAGGLWVTRLSRVFPPAATRSTAHTPKKRDTRHTQ
jgi:hypothetical protein